MGGGGGVLGFEKKLIRSFWGLLGEVIISWREKMEV